MIGFRRDDEAGAVAVITAIVLTVLLALMAFVVDFGLVRTDIRDSQNAADNASQAGVAALAEGKTYEEACQAAVGLLEVNLGISIPSSTCNNFAPGTFETTTPAVDCEDRAASALDATDTPGVVAPVYVEQVVGDYTIRIQMPVRDSDPQMTQQASSSDHDGTKPCSRIAISVRRSRDLIFGTFAGGSGQASGFADAVSRFDTGEKVEDIPSLIVLDPTGCRTLQVSSSGGRLIVRNLNQTDPVTGEVKTYPGIITVDSTGVDCGNAASDYVMRTNASAKLCSGVDFTTLASFLSELAAGTRGCDGLPETLRAKSFEEDNPSRGIYGRAADVGQVGPNIDPEPVLDEPITRQPVDHEWNCRATYPLAGNNWLPHYETTITSCSGRAANMDQLLDDLSTGTSFASASTWQTVSSCNPTGEVGDGTTNLYFSCSGELKITSKVVMNALDYIVVRGWVNVSTAAGDLYVNYDDNAGTVTANNHDVGMVVRGMKSGNPGVGFAVGSSSDLHVNRTMVYLHVGATDIDADSAYWTAPQPATSAYNDDGTPGSCTEEVSYSTPAYKLPSPECFENLALWTNNHGTHGLRGGAALTVEGVFFTPYAGRDSGAFDLAGGISQLLAKAQFFSYKFDMSGSSTLVLEPDPTRNLKIPTTTLILIR